MLEEQNMIKMKNKKYHTVTLSEQLKNPIKNRRKRQNRYHLHPGLVQELQLQLEGLKLN